MLLTPQHTRVAKPQGFCLTRKGTRRLTSRGSEQTSSELQTYPLLAKGTSMSEQKQSFMVELDL
jgi:hypothetical protein